MPARKPTPAPPSPARTRGQPAYEATEKDRLTVKVMVAGGIEQAAIAGVLGIAPKTLRKHFRREIDTAAAESGAQVVASIITMAVGQKPAPGRAAIAPNFNAAKWFSQARMAWSEHIVVDAGKPSDTPMRVIVELVGEAAPSRVEPSSQGTGSRLPESIRKTVQLVG
jgi:hypothetical protein